MTDLDDLIARLEAAEGPSRDLFWDTFDVVWPDGAPHDIWLRFSKLVNCEAFTEAALTLVPEGMGWTLYSDGSATVYPIPPRGMLPTDDYGGEAATPALALCIAALKARGAGAR